jgi:hypothetical protein
VFDPMTDHDPGARWFYTRLGIICAVGAAAVAIVSTIARAAA